MSAAPLFHSVRTALAALAGYQPSSAYDLAEYLRLLHSPTEPSVFGALQQVLESLTKAVERTPGLGPLGAGRIQGLLDGAVTAVSAAGRDRIDRAQEAAASAAVPVNPVINPGDAAPSGTEASS
jgi:hypothetical protein